MWDYIMFLLFRAAFRLPLDEKLDGSTECTLWAPYNKQHVWGKMYLSTNYICFESEVIEARHFFLCACVYFVPNISNCLISIPIVQDSSKYRETSQQQPNCKNIQKIMRKYQSSVSSLQIYIWLIQLFVAQNLN